jgi:hypothetical protein
MYMTASLTENSVLRKAHRPSSFRSTSCRPVKLQNEKKNKNRGQTQRQMASWIKTDIVPFGPERTHFIQSNNVNRKDVMQYTCPAL